eukprot:6189271-Pleurochrysis_carterae.AAC.2
MGHRRRRRVRSTRVGPRRGRLVLFDIGPAERSFRAERMRWQTRSWEQFIVRGHNQLLGDEDVKKCGSFVPDKNA